MTDVARVMKRDRRTVDQWRQRRTVGRLRAFTEPRGDDEPGGRRRPNRAR